MLALVREERVALSYRCSLSLTVCDVTAARRRDPQSIQRVARTSDPFADFVDDASRRFGVPVHWIRVSHRRRKRWRRARQVAERRNGADADHAGDVGGAASAVRPRQRSLRSRMTTFLRVLRTFANCTTATVRRASLQPTTRDLLATKSISPAVHCQLRPRPICRSLCQSSAATLQLPAQSRVCSHRQRSLFVVRSESSKTAARAAAWAPAEPGSDGRFRSRHLGHRAASNRAVRREI